MASIEFLQKRIDGANKNIEKLTKKLDRIKKAQETNWKVNPYYYDESDLKWTLRDLDVAKESLAKYEADLKSEQEKSASRNVPAIIEFLDGWKQRVTDFYKRTFAKYPEARKQLKEDLKPFEMDYFQERKMKRERFDEWKAMDSRRKAINEAFHARFGHLEQYVERALNSETGVYDSWAFDWGKLDKDLTAEYNRKYDFIIERTNAIVGTITDASNLYVGSKGDLNGFIIGTRGNAKVQTIGAGGYNIQCFHFRTLINKM